MADALKLPHPIRLDAVLGSQWEREWLHEIGANIPRALLLDPAASLEVVLNSAPALMSFAIESREFLGCVNYGLIALFLARAKLRAHGDQIYKLSAELEAQLAETEIGEGPPASLLQVPRPYCYLEMSPETDLRVHNRQTGEHRMEGCYLGQYRVGPGHMLFENIERTRALALDPNKPAMVVDVVFTGSPEHRGDPLDDASHNLQLIYQNDAESVRTILEKHERYHAMRSEVNPSYQPLRPAEARCMKAGVERVVQALLQMGLGDATMTPHLARTLMQQRIRGLGPKKRKREERRATLVYDHVLVQAASRGRGPGEARRGRLH